MTRSVGKLEGILVSALAIIGMGGWLALAAFAIFGVDP